MADDTQVVVTQSDTEDASVLAEAAVASAAVSGAAIATAENADDRAGAAVVKADMAGSLAEAALGEAAAKPSHEDVAHIIDQKLAGLKDEIVAAIKEATPAPKPVVVEELKKDEAPKRVESEEKKTWGQRFLGL